MNIYKTRQPLWMLTILYLALFITIPAQAGVVISGTRVIYPASENEVTIKLTNNDEKLPRLVKAWIDDGDENKTPDQIDVPFTLNPPIFRMEPNKGQALRMVHSKEEGLPSDKESLFWLNVLEVPPKPEEKSAGSSNTLQFAFRSRIKIFYRPEGLKGSVDEAVSQLRWKLLTNNGEPVLQVENPSAYNVSFNSIALLVNGKTVESESTDMVAPGATQRYPFKNLPAISGAKAEVVFTSISDYGEFVKNTAKLGV